MASLYKKPIVVTDPRLAKAKKSRKWWGRYRDAMGREASSISGTRRLPRRC